MNKIQLEDVKEVIITNMSNQIVEYINQYNVYFDCIDSMDENDIMFDNISSKDGIDYVKKYNSQNINNDFWYELALMYEDSYTLYLTALEDAKTHIKYKLTFFDMTYYGNNKEKIADECYKNYILYVEDNVQYTKDDILKMIQKI